MRGGEDPNRLCAVSVLEGRNYRLMGCTLMRLFKILGRSTSLSTTSPAAMGSTAYINALPVRE
jgi:hypothetical protein